MKPLQRLLYRPVIVAGFGLSLLLILVLVAFISLTWHDLERMHRIEKTVSQVNHLQDLNHRLQDLFLNGVNTNQLNSVKNQLGRLATSSLQPDLAPLTGLLQQADRPQLEEAIRSLQTVLKRENKREQILLTQVVNDTELELEAALVGLTVLILLLSLGALITWHWLLAPLQKMNALLLRLAEGRFEPIETDQTGPPWRPVLDNYNRMINRLAELERARQAQTRSLESQVRQATFTLLAQNRSLARAERLAAVGEVAASLAHELRNPLAGIRVALHNLRAECDDAETRRRFDLIIAEMERLSVHLNHLLNQARHRPESLTKINVNEVIGEVLALLRYQIPEEVDLHFQGSAQMTACLPETGLRQVLINLVLNSAQELGDGGGHIWVQADPTKEGLRLEISDDGPGFPNELLTQGIRPFASSRDGGTGLGLLMVKRFVASLHGQLDLKPRHPHGARIILEIPCTLQS